MTSVQNKEFFLIFKKAIFYIPIKFNARLINSLWNSGIFFCISSIVIKYNKSAALIIRQFRVDAQHNCKETFKT